MDRTFYLSGVWFTYKSFNSFPFIVQFTEAILKLPCIRIYKLWWYKSSFPLCLFSCVFRLGAWDTHCVWGDNRILGLSIKSIWIFLLSVKHNQHVGLENRQMQVMILPIASNAHTNDVLWFMNHSIAKLIKLLCNYYEIFFNLTFKTIFG